MIRSGNIGPSVELVEGLLPGRARMVEKSFVTIKLRRVTIKFQIAPLDQTRLGAASRIS